jgi:hypothetical protein
MKDLPPSRTADQYVVRFPDGMRDRIAEVARANGRSMNAEIIARLEASFSPPPSLPIPKELLALVSALESGSVVQVVKAGSKRVTRGPKK